MIRVERIAELIELGESFRFVMRRSHERQRGVAELLQSGFNEQGEFDAITNFAMLPSGFESGGMCEATGGERGVSQLPEDEI
jgi:hypothetical protein